MHAFTLVHSIQKHGRKIITHVWLYISITNKDRVLKFKISSKQKQILFALISLKKIEFRCADTLAETA